MAGKAWSDEENDATVAAYFEMLAEELDGRPYDKSASRRALAARIGRGEAAVEYKHRNVSAVVEAIGETSIRGYKPLLNYQRSLEDAVARWLTRNRGWLDRPLARRAAPERGFAEDGELIRIDPPPSLRNAPPPLRDLERTRETALRFDAAERDARNRALGESGEAIVLAHERARLRSRGKGDLAERVVWASKDEGDGLGYDIRSFEPDGQPRLIEVKTTRGWERTPFHVTRNELRVSEERAEAWVLFRLWNVETAPRAFELRPPLAAHAELTPMVFEATPR